MSNINISTIDVEYPVAGKDNDSQGFRDNFSSIKAGLSTAKIELTALQSSVILKHDLVTTDPVDNNLNGSSINNGSYNNFYGTSHTQTVNTLTTIDVSAASVHSFVLMGQVNFTFRNWPASGLYGKVKVHFSSDGTGTWEPTLYTETGGTIKYDDNYPNPLSVGTNGNHKVIEAWTFDGGNNVYIKYLGEF